jgi:hypothetical protein
MFDSPQTKFVAIFGIIALLVGTATTAVINNIQSTLYFIIGYLILILVGLSDVHCVISGGCELLGWMKTVVMISIFLISIVVFGYAVRLKKAEREYEAQVAAGEIVSGSDVVESGSA